MAIERLRVVSVQAAQNSPEVADATKDFKCPGPSCQSLHVVVIQGEVAEELSVVVVAKSLAE